MEPWQKIVIGVAACALLLFVGGRAERWMEKRGWIYNAKTARGGGGSAMLEFQKILEPQIEHVIEARQEKPALEFEIGDKPEPGEPPTRSS